jgi:hypothetical protein
VETDWTVYRTRFLIKARQLNQPLKFTDALGREHKGKKGDYLMECSDGLRRIAPRQLFEDVYVPMDTLMPEDVVTLSPLRKFPAAPERPGKFLRRQPGA